MHIHRVEMYHVHVHALARPVQQDRHRMCKQPPKPVCRMKRRHKERLEGWSEEEQM